MTNDDSQTKPISNDPELDDVTTETDTRWTYLASAITAVVLISFITIIALAAAGVLTLSAIPQGWFVITFFIVLMAATWLWGTDTLKEVRKTKQE